MGCDIHFYTERYTSDNDYDGPRDLEDDRNSSLEILLEERDKESERSERWVSADKWVLEEGYDEEEEPWWETVREERFYKGRNYYLFTVLAGVRDYGDTDIKKLAEPKGIPEDASFGYRTVIKQWGGDGHSFSYFTLEELLNVNWEEFKQEDWLDDFIDKTIPKMKLIDPDPSRVRCVFFFDN